MLLKTYAYASIESRIHIFSYVYVFIAIQFQSRCYLQKVIASRLNTFLDSFPY